MKKESDQISEGLNQLFEIINAKGDEGELKEIVDNAEIKKDAHKSLNSDEWIL